MDGIRASNAGAAVARLEGPFAEYSARPVTTGSTFLCFDLGLTHAKSVLFAAGGEVIARASVPYATRRPAPDRVEQEPDEWWEALRAGVAELKTKAPDPLSSIGAIGVTGHMHALVLEDARRRPIGPAFVLGDRRALAEAEAITAELGPSSIWQITGATLDPSMPAAELCWLSERDPDLLDKVALVTGAKDHIRGRLTGDRLSEPIDACATALYDIRKRRWSPELVDAAGITTSQLPDIVSCDMPAGALRADVARELGVRPGVPVITGAGDDVEVLAAGLVEPGVALEHLGTTGSILAVAAEPVNDPDLALELYPHAIPGLWVVGGSMTAAGAALAWVARLLGTDVEGLLLALEDPMSGGRHDDGLTFLPSLAGERSPVREPVARGAWLGLGSSFDRNGLAHAAFAGVAEGLARILVRVESLLGPQSKIAVSAGGFDLDPRWLSLRAATYGRPLMRLATPEPTALGLLAVVATGAGQYPDIATATRALARTAAEIAPDPELVELASRRRASREDLRTALRDVWPQLPA